MEGENLRNESDELHRRNINEENFSGESVGAANSGGAVGVLEVPLDLSADNDLLIVRAQHSGATQNVDSSSVRFSDIRFSDSERGNPELSHELAPRNESVSFLPLKAALDVLPKSFDGRNVPLSKFIRDCNFAYNSINPKEKSHLLWIIRSRITGAAEIAIQDDNFKTLQELIDQIKPICTEHRDLGQLNTMLATVAQGILESVNDYGLRVAEILKKITEFIEDTNAFEISKSMIISIRNTAKGNFIMGLRKELALRVRLENPKTLQDAINVARTAEWEEIHMKNLNRTIGETEVSKIQGGFRDIKTNHERAS